MAAAALTAQSHRPSGSRRWAGSRSISAASMRRAPRRATYGRAPRGRRTARHPRRTGDMPPNGTRRLCAHGRKSARAARRERSERGPSACVRQRMGTRGIRACRDTVHTARNEQGDPAHAIPLHGTGARPKPQRARAQRGQARRPHECRNDFDHQNRFYTGPFVFSDAWCEPSLRTRPRRTVGPPPAPAPFARHPRPSLPTAIS